MRSWWLLSLRQCHWSGDSTEEWEVFNYQNILEPGIVISSPSTSRLEISGEWGLINTRGKSQVLNMQVTPIPASGLAVLFVLPSSSLVSSIVLIAFRQLTVCCLLVAWYFCRRPNGKGSTLLWRVGLFDLDIRMSLQSCKSISSKEPFLVH